MNDHDLFEQIGDAALLELGKRLVDPEKAKELPATGLLNLGLAVMKTRDKEQQEKEEVDKQDEIEIILLSSLPDERKIQQLEVARERAMERVDLIDQAIGELNGTG
jgi:hypothetical protein